MLANQLIKTLSYASNALTVVRLILRYLRKMKKTRLRASVGVAPFMCQLEYFSFYNTAFINTLTPATSGKTTHSKGLGGGAGNSLGETRCRGPQAVLDGWPHAHHILQHCSMQQVLACQAATNQQPQLFTLLNVQRTQK